MKRTIIFLLGLCVTIACSVKVAGVPNGIDNTPADPGTPVASQTLAGTVNGTAFIGKVALAQSGFSGDASRSVTIYSSTATCDDPPQLTDGAVQILVDLDSYTSGTSFELDFSHTVTFVQQSGGVPDNFVITTGRVEVQSAGATGRIGLRANSSAYGSIEGDVPVIDCTVSTVSPGGDAGPTPPPPADAGLTQSCQSIACGTGHTMSDCKNLDSSDTCVSELYKLDNGVTFSCAACGNCTVAEQTASSACTAESTTGDTACGQDGTQSACTGCCQTNHSAGFATVSAAVNACICGTTGACQTECATEFCGGVAQTPGDACDTCITTALNTGGACLTPVNNACNADADCVAYLNCFDDECSSLPQ